MEPTHSLTPFVHPLPKEVWGEGNALPRSKEITPLYVERYCQPRSDRTEQTAHTYWEFIFAFGGRGSFRAGSETFALGPGAALLVPPGMAHGEYSSTLLDTLWVGLVGTGFVRLDASRLYVIVDREETYRFAERLWLLSEQKQSGCGPEIDGLCRCIVGSILRQNSSERASRLTGIERAIEYIHAHLAEPLSISAIAEVAGLSEGHFYRSFKRAVGVTPLEYVLNLRLRQSCRLLLETTLSVNRIAQLVGYRDACYFRRLFKVHRKMTPIEYRCTRK